jgi:hypothetical protein
MGKLVWTMVGAVALLGMVLAEPRAGPIQGSSQCTAGIWTDEHLGTLYPYWADHYAPPRIASWTNAPEGVGHWLAHGIEGPYLFLIFNATDPKYGTLLVIIVEKKGEVDCYMGQIEVSREIYESMVRKFRG